VFEHHAVGRRITGDLIDAASVSLLLPAPDGLRSVEEIRG